jgi:hypothetical protein
MRRLALPLALALSFHAVGPARADDRATAQELFDEGKGLLTAGKVEEACVKFAGAAELSQTPGVRLKLAQCYQQLGRTASAWTRFDEALTVAERTGDTVAAARARSGLATLKPQLSYLTVSVPTAVAGLTVTRDGTELPQAAWGAAVPVDPGAHKIQATAPGRVAWSTDVTVAGQGRRANVSVPALVEEGATPLVVAAPAIAPIHEEPASGSGLFSGPGGTQRTIAVASAGAGVAGLVLGSVFGAKMLSDQHAYEHDQSPTTGKCLNLECQTDSQSAVSAATVATVSFVAGGVLAATGVLLWFTSPKGPKAEVVPVPVAHGAVLSAQGSF